MGLLRKINQSRKNIEEMKIKDFENRRRQFKEEYDTLVHRYRCDWQAYMDFLEGGFGGIIPRLRVIDATEIVEEIDKKEREKKDESNKDL